MRRTLTISILLLSMWPAWAWAQVAQEAPQPDPRLAGPTITALQSLLRLKDAEAKAMSEDFTKRLKDLDDNWRAEFQGWCGDRPACGLEPTSPQAAK